MRLAPVHQRHHQQLGAVSDALDLEPHELVATFAQGFGGTHPLLLHQGMDCFTQHRAGDADEPPGLHQPDTGRLVRRLEQARKQRWRHLAPDEMAHIAALGDCAVHRRALINAEGMLAHGHSRGRKIATAATGSDGR
ncbi:hypothetical protein D9M68_774020 [compost metagenome]